MVVVVVKVKPLPKECCDGLVVLWFLLLDGLGTVFGEFFPVALDWRCGGSGMLC